MTQFREGTTRQFQPRPGPHCIFLQSKLASLAMSLLLGVLTAYAGRLSGDIHGVTRNAQGALLPGVKVQVHGVEDNSDRNIISDARGAFAIENLRPGRYQLRASKAGVPGSAVTTVSVKAQQDLRVDMTLMASTATAGAGNPARTAELRTPPASANAVEPPLTERERLLLERLDRLEQRLEAMEAREAALAGANTASAQTVPATSQPKVVPTSAALSQPAAPSQVPVVQQATARPALAASTSVPSQAASAPAPSAPAPSTNAGAEQPKPALLASLGTAGINSVTKPSTSSPPSGLVAAMIPPNISVPPAAKPVSPATVSANADPVPTADSKKKIDPFSDYDWTWLNGNPRTKDIYWDSKFFTPEIRSDVTATWDNQHPSDHSMGGSSELFRSGEIQLEQLGIGGDFHWDNVRGRFMTQFGAYSTATIRNDGSYTHGEWDIADADRYLSEAYGGYHFNVLDGINVDAGIFMSYIGLFSYYNFDNWAYQPSYVSSNTPWFFQGVRIQIFPTPHLKIEPWIINGWQSYDSSNNRLGLGGQLRWTPFPWMNIISNEYGQGRDDLYTPNRARIHSDNSLEVKYFDRPKAPFLDKMAFTFTGDIGCEYGGGVSCTGDHAGGPKQSFLGYMLYNRWWFEKDQFAITLGGGQINNPGRYLVLLPPINGMTAASAAVNSPYFTENPGNPFKAWDSSLTFDWMPKQYITFRIEPDYRHANVPYWSGHGGITPPTWANVAANVYNGNGYPTQYACMNGAPSGYGDLPDSTTACASQGGVWFPSLVKSEFLIDFDIMVKF